MAKKITEHQLEILEQNYFCFDDPVPFKENLLIFPVKGKDYYHFHNYSQVLTIDKNATPQGIPFSNLGYLISLMEKEGDEGKVIYGKTISLFELIFHVKNGIFCPNNECNYLKEKDSFYEFSIESVMNEVLKIDNKGERKDFLEKKEICPHCQAKMREIISIKNENNKKNLCIYNTEINKNDFDILREVAMYQNLPSWDNTEFLDQNLKAELEERDKILNKGHIPPTLEKQMSVIVAKGCDYTFEELKELSLRKLSLVLGDIDKLIHYQIYKTASMSGMVTFKTDIEHYLYSNKKHSAADEVFTLDALKEKMKNVT